MIEGIYGEGEMQMYSKSIIIILPNQWNISQGYLNGKEKRFKQHNKIYKGYNTRDHYDKNRFMGFYIDLTNIVTQSLDMPSFNPGQSQELF
jgi:hypothetical protein